MDLSRLERLAAQVPRARGLLDMSDDEICLEYFGRRAAEVSDEDLQAFIDKAEADLALADMSIEQLYQQSKARIEEEKGRQ